MLGNLLDNACKWARARVRLTCSKEGELIVIAVDDDGPGIEPSMREAVIRRGVRADEAAQGSGLGLAIVRDLSAFQSCIVGVVVIKVAITTHCATQSSGQPSSPVAPARSTPQIP